MFFLPISTGICPWTTSNQLAQPLFSRYLKEIVLVTQLEVVLFYPQLHFVLSREMTLDFIVIDQFLLFVLPSFDKKDQLLA